MYSHVSQLYAGIEDGQSSYNWLCLDMSYRRYSLVFTGITRLFPVDRTHGYDSSYGSLTNNPIGSSSTPFPSILHSYWLLGGLPD